jgi:hypothetical protein
MLAAITVSCSIIDKLKQKTEQKEETVTEQTEEITSKTSDEDLKFYNAYIGVVNKISGAVEQVHKSYLSEVPEPKSVRKGSMIFVIASDVHLGSLDRVIKEHKRSFYDNGDLAKLKPDNEEMKKEVEAKFKTTLTALEDYSNTARKVIDYYKNKEYEKDLSPAASYDEDVKTSYNKYIEAFDRFKAAVKKYKPARDRKDPDEISNPDERSAAILMDAYENTLDRAEEFYEKFQRLERSDDVSGIRNILDEFDKGFDTDKNKVASAQFTDRTKYMKYSFEDYFTKTVTDFSKEAKKFLDDVQGKKMSEKQFLDGFDDVIRYYNHMIDAYNTSINTLNTFTVF